MTIQQHETTSPSYVESRDNLINAHRALEAARVEMEYSLLTSYLNEVPLREIGKMIERDGSSAWERIRGLKRRLLADEVQWPNTPQWQQRLRLVQDRLAARQAREDATTAAAAAQLNSNPQN